jgi:preprotein translocase subunit SecD
MEDLHQPKKSSNRGIIIAVVILLTCVAIGLLYPFITKPSITYAHPSSGKPIPKSGTYMKLSVTPKVIGADINEQVKICAEILRKQFSQLSFPVEVRVNHSNIEIYLDITDFEHIDKVENMIEYEAKLSIHLVHRKTRELAAEAASEQQIVPGYSAFPHTKTDPTSGTSTIEQVLIRNKKELTDKDIKAAWVDPRDYSIINIELTEAGGKKMEAFTLSLTKTVDVIATVLDGKVMNYATLNAERLGKWFVISDLSSKDEAEKLCRSLQNPLTSTLKIIEQRPYSP